MLAAPLPSGTLLAQFPGPLSQLAEAMRAGLSFQYEQAWGFVLALHVAFFQRLGPSAFEQVKPTLLALEQFAKDAAARYHSVASQALSTAIRTFGPAAVLSVLPLQFDLPLASEGRREWMLSVLVKGVEGAPLAFFGTYVMPLINQLRASISLAEKQGDVFAEKHNRVLYTQVWELLPAFCTAPSDVAVQFKHLAKTIGGLLTSEPELRVTLVLALVKLIGSNRAFLPTREEFYLPEDEEDDEEDEEEGVKGSFAGRSAPILTAKGQLTEEDARANLQEIGRFAKNFFPLLFNIFCALDNKTGSGSGQLRLRSALYNAIKAFAAVAPEDVFDAFFRDVLRKILESGAGKGKADLRRRALLTELSQAFVESAAPAQLEMLYKVIKPQLSDADGKVQKKSYQVLERLCCQPSYLAGHLEELKEVLIASLSSSKATAKKSRLRCLRYVAHALEGDPVTQLFAADGSIPASEVLAEVIVCVKEANKLAREEAFQLLILLNQRSALAHPEDPSHFFQLVIAGLAGNSPTMISATVMALTRLAHQSKGKSQNSAHHTAH